jgi:tetratricopeptide (TPR) repeat protein
MKAAICLVALGLSVAPAQAQKAPARRASQTPTVDRLGEAYGQFLMAQRLEEGGEIDGAIAAYQRAIAADPKAPDLIAALADLYLRQNRASEAMVTANEALAVAPDNAAAHRVLGTILGSMATAETPRNDRQAQTQKDSLEKAIQHLEQSIAPPGHDNDVTVRAMLARLYVVAEKFDKAIPLLTQLVKEEPQWQDGAGLLVQAYAASGRATDAIRWLEEAAPDSPQLYSTLADFYGRDRRWREAADAYAHAVESMPRGYDLRLRYASALLNTGDRADVDKARQVVTEALGLRANDERGMLLLNQVERRSGDLDAAEQTARRVVAQNGRSARGYVALAETLEERQRYQELVTALAPAVAEFRAGASSATALAMLLPHMGFSYQQLHQFDRSISTFEELLKLSPGDQTLTAYLVQAHLAAKNYTTAADLARKGRADHPDEIGRAHV